MRKGMLVTLLLSLCSFVAAQQKTDTDIANLRGAVKTVRTIDFTEMKGANGKTVRKNISETFDTYDRRGNLLEKKTSVTHLLDFIGRSIFGWDANGARFERQRSSFLTRSSGQASRRKGGKRVPESQTIVRTLITTYEFNSPRQRLEATTRQQTGKLWQTDIYKFDERGRLVEHTISPGLEDGSGYKMIYKFDEKGVDTEISYFSDYGKLLGKTSYQNIIIDNQGNWTQRQRVATSTDVKGQLLKGPLTTTRQITYY